jgi:hypothetical protein
MVYEKTYRTLLSLYPFSFRERVGESMEQTFNDLCRERRDAGENLIGFVLWTFTDTLLGIIKEDFKSMNLRTKITRISLVIMIATLGILLGVWWVNGKDDTWLYVMCAIIAVSSIIPSLFSKNTKDQ